MTRAAAAAARLHVDLIFGQFVAGLSYGSTLFLLSAGLTLIFGVTRVVNFAHGSLYMVGAYVASTITAALPSTPLGFFAGLLVAALAVALVGALIEVVVLRRIYAAPEIFQLLATFGLVLVVQDLVLAAWGPEERFAPRAPGLAGSVELFGAFIPEYTLFLIVVGPLVFALLAWLLRRTRWGVWIRASAQDRETAGALGINEPVLFTSVFALGAFLAGLAGALQIPRETVNLQMDMAILVEAFVVVVVGGLGSVTGALWASLAIGLLHAFGTWWLPQSTLVLIFVVMAVVLVVRPHGLLGRPQAEASGKPLTHPPFVPLPPRAKWLWLAAFARRRAAAARGRRLHRRDRDRDGDRRAAGRQPALRDGPRRHRVVRPRGLLRARRLRRRARDPAGRRAVRAGAHRRRRSPPRRRRCSSASSCCARPASTRPC